MTRPTESNMGDILRPDSRMEAQATAAATEAMRRIGRYSGATRDAIRSTLWPRPVKFLYSGDTRSTRALKKEAIIQQSDLPRRDRTGTEKEVAMNRAQRLSIREEALVEQRGKIHVLPQKTFGINGVKAKDASDIDVTVDVAIDNTAKPWKDRILSEEEIVAMLTDKGKTLSGVKITRPYDHFEKDQAREVAKRYLEQVKAYQDLGKTFASNGTSELNVQTALAFSRDFADEVVGAVTTNKTDAEKAVTKARANVLVLQSVSDLAALTRADTSLSLEDVQAEIGHIEHDLVHINDFDTARTSAIAGRVYDEGYRWGNVPDQKDIRTFLRQELARQKSAAQKFRQIGGALERVYQNAKAADNVPSDLTTYVDGTTGKMKEEAFAADTDPKIIADALTRAMSLKSKDEMLREVEEKEKAASTAPVTPTGPEAILRVYEMHFSKQGMPQTEAKRAAVELYGRNAIGRNEWLVARSTLADQSIMGPERRIYQWPGQQLKELMEGSQESFICHIAESKAIGEQAEVTNRLYRPLPGLPGAFRLMDSTRRFGVLWRKNNARPSWSAMNYGQLLTSFYAIRSAIAAGDLNNTSYVRGTMEEITRLLIDKFSVRLANDMHLKENPDELKRSFQNAPQQEYIRSQIALLLAGAPIPGYETLAAEALAHSREQTGYYRKKVGRTIARVTGAGTTYGVKKPASGAKWAVTAPFRGIASVGRAIWDKGNQKSKFFS